MAQNESPQLRAEQANLNKGSFGVALGLVTASPQFLPAGGAAVSSLTVKGAAIAMNDQGLITTMRVSFVGDVANVAAQTITAQLLKNDVAVAAAVIAGLATTAGVKTGSVDFSTPGTAVGYVPGDKFTVTLTPSAGLTAAYTDAQVALG